jgi:hypothetical protein
MTIEADTAAQRSRRRRKTTATVAVITLALAATALARHLVHDFVNDPDASAPSCSWPAHVEHANSAQDGLIRCYLQALADHSTSGLTSVVRAPVNGGPIRFGPADFAHAADARSGTAAVTVIGNDNDSADATVAIHYADGANANLEIHTADPASGKSWRFWNIGIYPSGPSAPAPAIQ